MTTSYTSLLGLALPVTGELTGTWGDVVNDSITQLVEDSIAGYATASVTSGNWTLSTTGSGAANEARMMVLIPTGTPGVSRNILAPNRSKVYVVINQSDADVVLKGVTGPTTGVIISAGKNAVCVWNGSDFKIAGVIGPSSSTNNAIVTFDGVTGNYIKNNSNVTISGTELNAPTLSADEIKLLAQAEARFYDFDSSNYVALNAPTTIASDYVLTLPAQDGTANQSLTTDGAGVLSFQSAAILGNNNTFTGTQTFSGGTSALAAIFTNAAEPITISATAATGTINFDITTQSIIYYTSSASGNWTVNFRGNGTTALNSLMTTGQSVTAVFMATQGATAYYNSAIQVDGVSVTPKYQGGTAWSTGFPLSVDVYTYIIVKTGSAAFSVFASQVQFK